MMMLLHSEMACCTLHATMLNAQTCMLASSPKLFKLMMKKRNNNNDKRRVLSVRASSDDSDCNTEECAPDKEVGMVSMEWLAGDKTKVVGTYPPRKRGWTGYVEKDTAGQKNIYSVEPQVYIAESAISSGSAGSSADGAGNTATIVAGIAVISVAAASLILLQVGKNPSQIQTAEYSGPSLSYYIKKFKPPEIVQASVPPQSETSPSVQTESSAPDVSQVSVESKYESEPSTSSVDVVS